MTGILKIGEIYRYARPFSAALPQVDGLPNYFYRVHTSGLSLPLVDAGINPIARVPAVDGRRYPAIIIASSPHRTGSYETPWQDIFDADNGFIQYSGDNKESGHDPNTMKGNMALLRQRDVHNSPDVVVRQHAVPLIFFRRVRYGGRVKGNLEFQGFGIVTRAELVTQFHRRRRDYFSNYIFEFAVLSLADESEELNWAWISDRRASAKSLGDTLEHAPRAWRKWLEGGPESVERVRRRVWAHRTLPVSEQRPTQGSREEKALQVVLKFYEQKKSRFEVLAGRVAEEILGGSGAHYRTRWVTPPRADGGADFVGRLDVGNDFAQAKLVVLGQAKCESGATSGKDVARTVARLRRGWVGVYVTTSYFTLSVQREIIDDQYPLVLIHGKDLAGTVLHLQQKAGFVSVEAFLANIDGTYESAVRDRRPEEVLVMD